MGTRLNDVEDSKSEQSDVMTASDSGRGSNEDNRQMAVASPPSLRTYRLNSFGAPKIITMK